MAQRAPSSFDVDERLAELFAKGDDPKRMKGLVDFEMFCPAPQAALSRTDQTRGGRPTFGNPPPCY
jgi:IS5 family transposase